MKVDNLKLKYYFEGLRKTARDAKLWKLRKQRKKEVSLRKK